jgi:hypothetical protein
MPNKKSQFRRWLWQPSSAYRPSDQLIILSILIVAAVLVTLLIQGITGAGKPAHLAQQTVTTLSVAATTTTTGPVPPAALQVAEQGAAAQLDGDWTGIPLVPGITKPTSRPAPLQIPQVLSVVPLEILPGLLVATVSLRWHNAVDQELARVELIGSRWYYVPRLTK